MSPPTQGEPRPPAHLRIVRELGSGAQARVYLAVERGSGRRVALRSGARGRESFLLRRRLRHPSIVAVRDLVTSEGCSWLIEEYIEGPRWDQRPPRGEESIATAAGALLGALHYLHRRGIVHRDIKPANILLRERQVAPVLIDFGLATCSGNTSGPSGSLGTAAPEVLAGSSASAQGDLFALGATLLAALEGGEPRAQWSLDPHGLLERALRAPAALVPLLRGLLSPRPEERFSSAAAARRALSQSIPAPALDEPEAWPVAGCDAPLDHLAEALGRPGRGSQFVCVRGERGCGRRALAELAAREVRAAGFTPALAGELGAPGTAHLERILEGHGRRSGEVLIAWTAHPQIPDHLREALGAQNLIEIEPVSLQGDQIAELLEDLGAGAGFDVQSLQSASGGHPGALVQILAGLRGVPRESSGEPLAAVLYLAALGRAGRPRESPEEPSREAFERARRAGQVRRQRDGSYELIAPGLARRSLRRAGADRLARLHASIAAALDEGDPWRPFHLVLGASREPLGPALDLLATCRRERRDDELEDRLLQLVVVVDAQVLRSWAERLYPLAHHLLECSRTSAVEDLIERLQELGRHPVERALRGRLMLERGETERAYTLLSGVYEEGALQVFELAFDLVRTLRASSRWSECLPILAHAQELGAPSPEARAAIGQVRSLVYHRLGQSKRAVAEARAALSALGDRAPSTLSLSIVQNLAMMERHRGHLEEAERLFGSAAQGLRSLGDLRAATIVAINQGIAAQDLGDLDRSRALKEEALRLSERLELEGLAQVARAGLGITLALQGYLPAAFAHLEEAEQAFDAQGQRREATLARCHRLQVLCEMGGGDENREELVMLLRAAQQAGDPPGAAAVWAALLEQGWLPAIDPAGARTMLRRCDRGLRERLRVALHAGRLGAAGEAADRSVRALERLSARALAPAAARAQRVLAAHGIAPRCNLSHALRFARSSSSAPLALSVHLDALRLHRRSALTGPCRCHLRRIAKLVTIMLRDHPAAGAQSPLMRPWLERLGEISSALENQGRSGAGTSDVLGALLRLHRMLLDPRQGDGERFQAILDEAVALTSAHRGAVLVRDDRGRERIAAGVRFDPGEGAIEISRNLINHVIETGEAKLTTNAMEDPDLRGAFSVERFRLSSIACVPIRAGVRILGVLYLDNPHEHGAFEPGSLDLLEAFANQISISLSATFQRERIARLNEQLEGNLRARTCELEAALNELAGARQTRTLIYHSEVMHALMERLRRLAGTDLAVCIQGETGTGKELVARRLHELSSRRERAFVSENCAAIPGELLESELFGHVKGAFSGALRDKPGLFQMADGGTLFLDEIGDLSLALQAKLLRALQDGEVRPVGSDRPVPVDLRVLSATHRDLAALVAEGSFREDLFYRVHVASLEVPSLRSRREDIALLARHFLALYGGEERAFSERALALLEHHNWPGNVRELESAVRSAAVLAHTELIEPEDLPVALHAAPSTGSTTTLPLLDLKALERLAIEQALKSSGGHRVRAARLLGISRSSIFNKIRQYKLS